MNTERKKGEPLRVRPGMKKDTTTHYLFNIDGIWYRFPKPFKNVAPAKGRLPAQLRWRFARFGDVTVAVQDDAEPVVFDEVKRRGGGR